MTSRESEHEQPALFCFETLESSACIRTRTIEILTIVNKWLFIQSRGIRYLGLDGSVRIVRQIVPDSIIENIDHVDLRCSREIGNREVFPEHVFVCH